MKKLNISHNVKVLRPHKQVREGLETIFEMDYLTISLQEIGGYLEIIRDLAAKYNYRLIVATNSGKGMNSSALLVKHHVERAASGVAKSRFPWKGPNAGIIWPGRAIPWAIIVVDGVMVLITSIHAPWGRNAGRMNRLAFRMFLRRLRKLYRKKLALYPGLKFFFPGDWNCDPKETGPRTVQKLLVKKLDGWVVDPKCTPRIDYGVTNLPILIVEKRSDFGSDHDCWSTNKAA